MSQLERLREVLSDGKAHRSDELLERVYGAEHLGLARLGARVYELKAELPPTQAVRSWRDKERRSLTWYQVVTVEQAPPVQRGLFDGTVSESA